MKLPASWISVLLWPSDPPQRPDVDPEHVKQVLDDAPNGCILNELAEIDPGASEAPIDPSVANNANRADPPTGQGASRTGTADTFLVGDITPRSESFEQDWIRWTLHSTANWKRPL